MQRLLSLEQTPPFSVPLRFFLTAPLFAAAAGLVLVFQGEAAFTSRWTPAMLAATHLVTLGFLALVMIGALMQILPVVAGIEVARPMLTALSAHTLLTLGAISLSAGFLAGTGWLFQLALIALGLGFAGFLLACWLGMRGTQSSNITLKTARLALLSLLVTASAGLVMLLGYGWGVARPALPLTTLHVGWGLGGWIGLLVAGVAYQVVPMFQITPTYPASVTRWLAKGIFTALIVASFALMLAGDGGEAPVLTAQVIAAMGYLAFAIVTINLLRQRKRPQREATTLFWYTSLASLLAGCALFIASLASPSLLQWQGYPLMIGMLLLAGFACSVTNGMLYKIVPFLAWYHLQNQLAGVARKAPNIKQFISERRTRLQFGCHGLGLILLLAACAWPERFAYPAALAFIASSLFLWLNLLSAARMYRAHSQAAAAIAPAASSAKA